jgi:hypothetical protein
VPGTLWYLTAMALVAALAWAVARWLGRYAGGQSPGRRLQALEVLPLGRDRSVILLRAVDRLLLVGAGPQHCNLLADLGPAMTGDVARAAGPMVPAPPAASAGAPPGSGGRGPAAGTFQGLLASLLPGGSPMAGDRVPSAAAGACTGLLSRLHRAAARLQALMDEGGRQ